MLSQVWNLFTSGLALKAISFERAASGLGFRECLFLFAFAVVSKSAGEAGMLYINRASKGQYIRGLLGSLTVLAFASLVWSGCIWLSCNYLLGTEASLRGVLTVVLVSYFPLVFSFLGIIPHLGLLIFRLLTLWGLAITVAGLGHQFGLGVWQALASSAVGWLFFTLLNSSFGGAAERVRLRLLGRDQWVKPKEAAVALLESELQL